jgi:hypothetical protein
MRRTLTTLALVLLVTSGTALAQTYGAVLTASQETPPSTSSGFGNATVSFTDATHTQINVTITVSGLGSPINNYHIHEGALGTAGPVRVNLIGLGGTFTNGKLTGTFPITATDATNLIAHPETFYVNVHTAQFPSGAIRGQLSPVSGTIIQYAADLRGSNEAPTPNSSTAFGSALVTIDTAAQTVTWEVTTSGIASPTLAHIHGPGGNPGTAVGVFINFATSAAQIPGGRTKGTASTSGLDQTNFNKLLTNPGEFYVNVHSTQFGGGEIRGQLVPAKEVDLGVSGKVGTFATDVRVFNPSYDAAASALLEYFPAGTTANTNAPNTMVVNIPPRGTATLNDVNGAASLNSGSGIGAIRVSSASAINATSRIFSTTSGTGTFGQFLQGIPRAGALRRGVLPQLQNDTAFRTNVGFFNPNNAAVTVRLDLRNEAGTVVASSVQTFNALTHQQNSIGTYFPGVDVASQSKLTLSFDASAPIDVYAAVNDNATTDSFVVTAQEDTGVSANQS